METFGIYDGTFPNEPSLRDLPNERPLLTTDTNVSFVQGPHLRRGLPDNYRRLPGRPPMQSIIHAFHTDFRRGSDKSSAWFSRVFDGTLAIQCEFRLKNWHAFFYPASRISNSRWKKIHGVVHYVESMSNSAATKTLYEHILRLTCHSYRTVIAITTKPKK